MSSTVEPALYAPQARLVDLASGQVIGTTVNARGPGPTTHAGFLSSDLLSARVTLPNTGIGQLQVTLNNQRYVDNKPVFPPWKYNDFSSSGAGKESTYSIRLGQKLRLDLRYSNMPWVKMMVARVTDLQFTFPQSGGAQLQVIAEDLLSTLKIKPKKDIPYDQKQEERILAMTAEAAKLPFSTRSDGIEPRPQPWRSARQLKTQTYFQFLSDIADRLDCELYIDFQNRDAGTDSPGTISPGPVSLGSELVLVMEPARSKKPPTQKVTDWKTLQLANGQYLELRWGKSLVEFTPKLKVWEMPTSATVSGSQPNRRGRVTGTLTADQVKAAIKRELPKSPSYADEAIDAVSARTQYCDDAGDDADNQENHDGSNLDEARAKMKALAQVLKKVREFMTVEASTIGVPMLRPGVYVHILGLRPPFDGFYYVTKTVHTYDTNGYRTQFSLRRPGMLKPEKYLELSSEEKAASQGGPL